MRPNRAVRAALNVTVPPMALRVLRGQPKNQISDTSQAEASPNNRALTKDDKEPGKRAEVGGYTELKDWWHPLEGDPRGWENQGGKGKWLHSLWDAILGPYSRPAAQVPFSEFNRAFATSFNLCCFPAPASEMGWESCPLSSIPW